MERIYHLHHHLIFIILISRSGQHRPIAATAVEQIQIQSAAVADNSAVAGVLVHDIPAKRPHAASLPGECVVIRLIVVGVLRQPQPVPGLCHGTPVIGHAGVLPRVDKRLHARQAVGFIEPFQRPRRAEGQLPLPIERQDNFTYVLFDLTTEIRRLRFWRAPTVLFPGVVVRAGQLPGGKRGFQMAGEIRVGITPPVAFTITNSVLVSFAISIPACQLLMSIPFIVMPEIPPLAPQ